MSKKGILEEAIGDAQQIKEAAIKNAENSLAVHFRESLESVISEGLERDAGDELEDDEGDDLMEMDEHDPYGDVMSEMEEEEEDFDFGDEDEEDADLEEGLFGDDDEGLEEAAGMTEADLQAAIREALQEVDHGGLGEMEEVDPDSHDSGLLDQDMKEGDGWQEKTAPAKKDYYAGIKEVKRLRGKVAKLVAENTSLRKANRVLKESVREVNLFNKKLFVTHKLIKNQGLTESAKVKIVKRIDAARSPQEVDSIFESLKIALGVLSESAGSRKGKKATTLSESLGRHTRNEKGVSDVRDAHLLSEDARYAKHRLQVLAGLKPEEN